MKKLYCIVVVTAITMIGLSGQTVRTIQHGATSRTFKEYIPASYTGSEPYALIICLHGLGDNMTNFSGIGMHLMGDTAKFITVYPQAMASAYGTAWNSGASYMGIVLNPTIDDVGFLTALMDTMSIDYNIDQTKIYVMGFSMGGFMSNRMACEKGDRVAAIASVAGTIGTALTCNPIRPIPVCHIHGTADGTVGYTGNLYGMDAPALVDYWVEYNQCDTPAVYNLLPDLVVDGYTVETYLYPGGDQNSKVLHYKVIGADHTWLIPITNDISYAIEIWKFFYGFSHPSLGVETTQKVDYRVYPNPASDWITISFPTENSLPVSVSIMNLSGQVLLSTQSSSPTIQLNVDCFAPGIYLLTVGNDTFRSCRRFVIE